MKRSILILCLLFSFLSAAELHIGFIGNNRGLLTPCGCSIPSGGLARNAIFFESLASPQLRVGTGNHFFHHTPMPKEDQIFEQKKAAFQAMIFSELRYDVINTGQFDLCYGLKVLTSLRDRYDLPLISANILDMDGNLAFPPYKVIKSQGLDILFVGICTLNDGFNFKIGDPLKALTLLEESGIFDSADFVILLADAPAKLLSDFVKDHEGIDLIVGSKEHMFTGLPVHYMSTALVQMGSQGKYGGHLRLVFNGDSESWEDLSVYDHYIRTAESAAKADPAQKKKVAKQIKKNKNIRKKEAERHPFNYHWNITLLDNKIKDDPEIKKRVEELMPYPGE